MSLFIDVVNDPKADDIKKIYSEYRFTPYLIVLNFENNNNLIDSVEKTEES